MTFHDLFRYLVSGSEELVLPKDWLANTERLRRYDHWTKRQRYQGSIVADTREMRRRAFWKAVEATRTPVRSGNVVEFERASER